MTTLATLRTTARTELQEAVAGFWADSELTLWVNEANGELIDAAAVDATSTLTLVANTESYSLPADFSLARRVEIQVPGASAANWMVLQPLSIDLRSPGDPLNTTTLTSTPTGWYVFNNKLYLIPIPDQSYTGTLYYFKRSALLVGDSDALVYPEGFSSVTFDKAIVDYVVAKALTKRQDNAYTIYAGRYNAGLGALQRFAEERGNSNPMVVINDWDWE